MNNIVRDERFIDYMTDSSKLRNYVYTHVGPSPAAEIIYELLESFDKSALVRYVTMYYGMSARMTDQEREKAILIGDEFCRICTTIQGCHYIADLVASIEAQDDIDSPDGLMDWERPYYCK